MGDMGLQNAGAAASLQDLLRQRIIDRINAEAVARHNMESDRNFGMQQQQMDFAHQQRTDALNETARQHDLNAANQTEDNNRALNEQIPAGTAFPTADPNAMQLVGRLRTVGGVGGAPEEAHLPSTQTEGGMTMPSANGSTGTIRGSLVSMNKEGNPEQYRKLASSKQQTVQEAADAKVEAARLAAENRTNDNEQKNLDRLAQIKAAAAGRPVADKLTKVEHKGPDGRTVIEYLPQSEVRGKTFEKGAGAAAEGRLASAQAVNQTGDDIVQQLSNPNIANALGPVMGRYNSLQEFIGNPPPELSELAGQIESYALASMGVHGMRSAAGAAKINEMLSKKHTPESLAASIRGLSKFSQHFMQNEGRTGAPTGNAPAAGGGTVSMRAPDGRALSVPADKVAEMEAHGAKRVQ